MRYTVTAYRESSFAPYIETVGDDSALVDAVCQRLQQDEHNMVHAIYVWDWHTLTLCEYNLSGENTGDYVQVSQ
jgi:hypothetical protein